MSADSFQPITGMSDIGPGEVGAWQSLETAARRVFTLYGFEEIRTPVLERIQVFLRSLGDTTDVVQKEMYTLTSRDGSEQYALRPEGTAGVMRYVASQGQEAQDARLYYCGPMFRGERPQKGRRRQFHQIGVESIGSPSAAADAETIALQVHLLREWGLKGFELVVNSLGTPEDRPAVQQGLRDLLARHADVLCEDCRRRLATNVLRVLDCKREACRGIVAGLPPITQFMSTASQEYLREVLALLAALDIPVTVRPTLVRGFDYYLHTVWEITHPALGAQDSLSGGGRYRIELGGRAVEGVGFAIGVERALMAVAHDVAPAAPTRKPLAWLVSMGEAAFAENFRLAQALRLRGIAAGMDLGKRSMKAQMRGADRAGAAFAVVRGDNELAKGTFMLKDLANGQQSEVDMPELLERLRAIVLAS